MDHRPGIDRILEVLTAPGESDIGAADSRDMLQPRSAAI
jgi:hypothetical protein